MSRIRLLPDEELSDEARSRAREVEAGGGDASVLRAVGHRQDMFDRYFAFYYPAHLEGRVEAPLKELVRLEIARHNDCFT